MSGVEYKQNLERYRDPNGELRSQIRFYAWLLLIVAAICFLFTQVLIGVRVNGSSMLPTLQNGDYLFVCTLTQPSHGDIVVIEEDEYENGEIISKWLIKRVIGLPGDSIRSEDGILYRTDAGTEQEYAVEEPYLYEEWWRDNDIEKLTVPEGYVYVLGDNRNDSHDSREIGCLPLEAMLGVVTHWSIDMKDTLSGFFGLFS